MRVVLANGCFDLLHPGHVSHLREARAMGDVLVVGLTDDEHVGKPGRPIQKWDERASMLRSVRYVSRVVRCKNAVEAIRSVRPSIFVKGSDYAASGLLDEELAACEEVGATVAFTSSAKKSTSELIERIKACAS